MQEFLKCNIASHHLEVTLCKSHSHKRESWDCELQGQNIPDRKSKKPHGRAVCSIKTNLTRTSDYYVNIVELTEINVP